MYYETHKQKNEKKNLTDSSQNEIKDWQEYLKQSNVLFNFKFTRAITKYDSFTSNDFNFIKTIGTGAYGRVMLIQRKGNQEYYAAKLQTKEAIVKKKQVRFVKSERDILNAILFPFTINLIHFFQDNVYLYFVLPFVEGGDMYVLLRKRGKFDEQLSRFYAAQILLALEYLHYLKLIYRDLKPENILLDRHGFIKVTDFGFCKLLKYHAYTFCGTPEYMAPEIIASKGYSASVDYWSLGVLLYEFNSGVTPFYAKQQYQIFNNITAGNYQFKPYFSSDLRDLISHLLQSNISKRYGVLKRGIEDIKSHKWFNTIKWLPLVNKSIKAPYIPPLPSYGDTTFFSKDGKFNIKTNNVDEYKDVFFDF